VNGTNYEVIMTFNNTLSYMETKVILEENNIEKTLETERTTQEHEQ
jgi:hypothetical protein